MRKSASSLSLLPVPFFVLFLISTNAFSNGTLSPNIGIYSEILGYPLQYRVYFPETAETGTELPTIYISDGQWYLEQGGMIEVLDREIALGNIEPVVAVFVDSRNPDDLSENRRNQQFMCSQKYLGFYLSELIPAITSNFPVSSNREKRVITGVSFGGLNAACFGLMASNAFAGIGMQSPASGKHLKVLNKQYEESSLLPLEIFFSVGTKKDNTKESRQFRRTLEKKGYHVNYIEVPYGHAWSNWRPLIDDLLLTFFATK